MSFHVVKAGFLSMIQDYGRFGFSQFGLSQSGASDEHAFCWANHLLANHYNDAVIEITFGACIFEVKTPTQIVVTGADLNFKINGKKQPLWQVINVKEGDILSWGTTKKDQGIRAYLAVKGGFQSQVNFNSRSVTFREGIGKPIQQGDRLDVGLMGPKAAIVQKTPWFYRPNHDGLLVLRILPTYQFELFSTEQKDCFFGQSYSIAVDSDRTGCRLQGKAIEDVPSQMISEAMSYGSVEITTAGLPIILLKEAPTIGGYPKIGTVFSLDLARLAQRASGTSIRFELIPLEEAQQLRKQFNTFFGIGHAKR